MCSWRKLYTNAILIHNNSWSCQVHVWNNSWSCQVHGWKFVWQNTTSWPLSYSTETASYWTNNSAQSTTPVLISWTIPWEMQTLPWDDGGHRRASVETPSLLSQRTSTRVFLTYVADWLRSRETSNKCVLYWIFISLLLKSGPVETGPTGRWLRPWYYVSS